ncbi:MAG TPA: dTMP kinase [Vicinamibacterales bacterium]|nr:dTMP kinase [Vicinamibacterales bacterium]
MTQGLLIAFEGLDQSGKQTQAELVRDRLIAGRRSVYLLSFPDYGTPIGEEIERALRGARNYAPDVMQLLYVANRYEWRTEIERRRSDGEILICDRYLASSVAYGEAQGLDPAWLLEIQRYLPQPDLTFLLDIAPAVSATRKTADRDRYERDLALLGRVRNSYLQLAEKNGWERLSAERDKAIVAADVWAVVERRL